ncbi:alpha/beta fold hydrolase [Streptomyces sp. NPDC058685]|uniref:alpha/beta fold hydrolase n=1 Tax=Streptomyces sp. NPDC058685 TaxID=3346598 RepID=UPI003649270E
MNHPHNTSSEDGPTSLVPVIAHPEPPRAAAAVLLLHGGRADALGPPPTPNLPGLRMRPFASAISRNTALDDVLVAHVRYRHRGWNGHYAHPVADAQQALEELRALTGAVPVVLVGHSMGARAALRAAADPQVRGVIALAPWCPHDEPVAHLASRSIVALHDEADRVTHATDTWSHLTRAQNADAQVMGIRMPRGGHAMIRHAHLWHRVTAAATAALLGLTPLPADLARPSTWTGEPRPLQDVTC